MDTDIWGSNGVVGNIIVIQAINIIGDVVYELFNPIYVWKKIFRWYYIRKIRKSATDNRVLQTELNYTFEEIEFDIAERYYMTFKLISVAFFFQTVSPTYSFSELLN